MADFSIHGSQTPNHPIPEDDDIVQGCFSTMPEIEIYDPENTNMAGTKAAFIKSRSYHDGISHKDTPPQGKLLISELFFDNSKIVTLRTLAHELSHSSFDKLSPEQQDEVVKLFFEANPIQNVKDFLFASGGIDIYQIKYDSLLKNYGEKTANRFLVDEVIAPYVSFMLYMPEITLYNKPSEEGLKELILDMGTLEAVKDAYEDANLEWREPRTPDEWLPLIYNVPESDMKWYLLKGNGINITPQLEASLRQYCLIPTREIVEGYYEDIKNHIDK